MLFRFVEKQAKLACDLAHEFFHAFCQYVLAHPDREGGDSQRAAEIKIPKLNLAYRGTANLARESLPPFVIMPPWKPVTGWVAISALAVVHDPKGYAWLDAYKPLELVGKTIELYYIPPARP